MAGGQQSDLGQGDYGKNALIQLKSRKTGTGSATRELSGSASTVSAGEFSKARVRAISGSSVTLTSGIVDDGGVPVAPSSSFLSQQIQPPTNPFNAFSGIGKHFIFARVGTKHYMVGHDGQNWPDTGVATQPTEQDGRQNIEAVEFANPEPVWSHVQDYWPAYATTNGYLFWNPDDAGGFTIGGGEIICFRSTGVINPVSGFPDVGTMNYPGSGSGAGLVGTLIGNQGNYKFGIYNPSTGYWREGPTCPSELAGDKCWGGAYDSDTNRAYFVCEERKLICIDLTTGTDLTPRSVGGGAQSLQFSAVMDNPSTMHWSVPRGFIANGPNGEGKCFWGWDTANHYLVIVNLTKYHSWDGTEFAGGNTEANFPMSRVRAISETVDMGGQNNTSLTLDLATDTICVWGTGNSSGVNGYLHMLPRATALTADWVTVVRTDKLVNDLGQNKFAQRHYYDPNLEKTLAIGVLDFTGNLPYNGYSPYWLIDTKVPSWVPDFNTVSVLCGPAHGTNSSTMNDHDPGSGVWNANGAKNLQNLVGAWNSGYYNPYGTGQYGNYGRAGGGDADRTGNDVYDLSLSYTTPTWRRLVTPSGGYNFPPVAGTDYLTSSPVTGEIVVGGSEQTGIPFAPHTYDNMILIPPAQSGHTYGAMCWPRSKFFYGPTTGSNLAHKVNLGVSAQTAAASAWSRASDTSSGDTVIPSGVQGVCCWDAFSKRVLFTGTSGSTTFYSGIQQLASWSGGVGTWSNVSGLSISGSTEMLKGDPTAEWWDEQRLMVIFGATSSNTFGIQLIDVYSSPNFANATLSIVGDPPPVSGEEGWGVCFVPRLRAFFLRVAHTSAKSQKIWRIQPPAFATPNVTKSGTWTVTEITMPGATVAFTNINGLWKAFRYAEKADVIIWTCSHNGNTYVYRPPYT